MDRSTSPSHDAAEAVARDSYGRLVALLSARCRDVSAVEDALAEAFVQALESWPRTGVPDQPEAWLLTVSRRRLADRQRRQQREDRHMPDVADLLRGEASPDELPDERLKLLLVCAHPAIEPPARAPLMLQTVFGFDAARIASAFLASPAAMSQRLVRAKLRIRELRIPFEVPETSAWPARVESILDAIYAVYGTAWDDLSGADDSRTGLGDEAIRLARLLARLLPDEPEVSGLLALCLYCEARRPARLDAAGRYVPLSAQDTRLWRRDLIGEAETCLGDAARHRQFGRYQLEAAIQSAHSRRAFGGSVDGEDVLVLYDELVRLEGSLGAEIGRAAAIHVAGGSQAALAALDGLRSEDCEGYQPYWAVRAHVLESLGRKAAARSAYDQAIGLCLDAAVRTYLLDRRQHLDAEGEP